MTDERCPATTRHVRPHSVEAVGVQCKFTKGHQGDHAGYAGFSGEGDIFWTDAPIGGLRADEDKIREAVTEARDHPGRVVTR